MIRPAQISDAKQIARIYNYYIEHSTHTFEEEILDVSAVESKMEQILSNLPWLVYEEAGKVLGYAYATRWRVRSAYRFSVESSVYIDKDHFKRGIGRKLYASLFDILKDKGIHLVIGGITLPNEASVILHEKMGFEKVAHFKEVGYKFNKWLDVGYWQLILE
jgi:phosphinothricin acetyltransferase